MDNLGTKETRCEILKAESSDEADKSLSQARVAKIVSMVSFRPSDMLFENSKISQISFNPSKQSPLYEENLVQIAMERKCNCVAIPLVACMTCSESEALELNLFSRKPRIFSLKLLVCCISSIVLSMPLFPSSDAISGSKIIKAKSETESDK